MDVCACEWIERQTEKPRTSWKTSARLDWRWAWFLFSHLNFGRRINHIVFFYVLINTIPSTRSLTMNVQSSVMYIFAIYCKVCRVEIEQSHISHELTYTSSDHGPNRLIIVDESIYSFKFSINFTSRAANSIHQCIIVHHA